jgi:hypothetical protein
LGNGGKEGLRYGEGKEEKIRGRKGWRIGGQIEDRVMKGCWIAEGKEENGGGGGGEQVLVGIGEVEERTYQSVKSDLVISVGKNLRGRNN